MSTVPANQQIRSVQGNMHASASLYVGDLSPDVPEGKLYEIFNNIGQLQSVRILRDVNTRKSLGYAYVNYHRVDDAERALEIMNYKVIGDRACRIMWSNRDPQLRKSGKGNIYIKGLAPSIDHETLRDTFTQFGNILSCKVVSDSEGVSRGYGFVHFANEADAKKAIEAVNGKALKDQIVTVAPFLSKAQRGGRGKFTNVYCKNLPRDMPEESVLKMFQEFGEVNSHVLTVAADEGKTNFAFFNFSTPEQAQAAVDGLNDRKLGDKNLYVARAQKKEERQKELRERHEKLKAERHAKFHGVNLYIKNLSDAVTDEKLRELFSQFGDITSAKVMCDEAGKSKGFGFVCFTTTEEAQKAVGMNASMHDGKPLYVAIAQRKEERRATIESNMQRRNMQKNQGNNMYGSNFRPAHIYGGMQGHWQGAHMMPMHMPNNRQFQLVQQTGQHRGPQRRGRNNQNRGQGQPHGQQYPRHQQGMRGQRGPPQQQHQAPPQQQAPVNPQDLPTADFVKAAASLPDPKRKHLFGERLFPLVHEVQPDLAPKITGMLLEMEDSEIVELLESGDALQKKIAEALSVLEDASETTN